MGYTNQSPGTDQTSSDANPRLSARTGKLEECGEIAATRLAIALSDALNQVVDQLFAKGIQGAHTAEQQHWLAAADFARIRRNDIVDAFARHFERHYAEYCQQKLNALAGKAARLDINELRLVEVDALEYAITPDLLIEAIRNGTWLTLPDLTRWFKETLGAPDMQPLDMPLGPKPLGAAVTLAINEQFGKPDAKQRVTKALCRPLPDLINRFYQDMNQHVAGGQSASADRPPPAGSASPKTMQTQTAEAIPPSITIDPDSVAAAHAAIGKRLARIKLPEFIADFLYGPWQRLLASIHQDTGQASPEWEQAFRTMEELLRSLNTKRSPEDCLRLTRELPDLAKRLAIGIETIGESAAMHDRFFKRLADYHIRLLGKLGASGQTAQPPGNPEPVLQGGNTHDGGNSGADTCLDAIEIGTWLEFLDRERPTRKLKLAWISPNRSLFLLTNHLGERALSVGPKDLADMLRSGTARVIATAAPPASGAAAPIAQVKKTA